MNKTRKYISKRKTRKHVSKRKTKRKTKRHVSKRKTRKLKGGSSLSNALVDKRNTVLGLIELIDNLYKFDIDSIMNPIPNPQGGMEFDGNKLIKGIKEKRQKEMRLYIKDNDEYNRILKECEDEINNIKKHSLLHLKLLNNLVGATSDGNANAEEKKSYKLDKINFEKYNFDSAILTDLINDHWEQVFNIIKCRTDIISLFGFVVDMVYFKKLWKYRIEAIFVPIIESSINNPIILEQLKSAYETPIYHDYIRFMDYTNWVAAIVGGKQGGTIPPVNGLIGRFLVPLVDYKIIWNTGLWREDNKSISETITNHIEEEEVIIKNRRLESTTFNALTSAIEEKQEQLRKQYKLSKEEVGSLFPHIFKVLNNEELQIKQDDIEKNKNTITQFKEEFEADCNWCKKWFSIPISLHLNKNDNLEEIKAKLERRSQLYSKKSDDELNQYPYMIPFINKRYLLSLFPIKLNENTAEDVKRYYKLLDKLCTVIHECFVKPPSNDMLVSNGGDEKSKGEEPSSFSQFRYPDLETFIQSTITQMTLNDYICDEFKKILQEINKAIKWGGKMRLGTGGCTSLTGDNVFECQKNKYDIIDFISILLTCLQGNIKKRYDTFEIAHPPRHLDNGQRNIRLSRLKKQNELLDVTVVNIRRYLEKQNSKVMYFSIYPIKKLNMSYKNNNLIPDHPISYLTNLEVPAGHREDFESAMKFLEDKKKVIDDVNDNFIKNLSTILRIEPPDIDDKINNKIVEIEQYAITLTQLDRRIISELSDIFGKIKDYNKHKNRITQEFNRKAMKINQQSINDLTRNKKKYGNTPNEEIKKKIKELKKQRDEYLKNNSEGAEVLSKHFRLSGEPLTSNNKRLLNLWLSRETRNLNHNELE